MKPLARLLLALFLLQTLLAAPAQAGFIASGEYRPNQPPALVQQERAATVSLLAGRDVVLGSEAITTSLASANGSTASRTTQGRASAISATGAAADGSDASLAIRAGRDVAIRGADLASTGDLAVIAERNIDITSLADANRIDSNTQDGMGSQGRSGHIRM